MGMDIYGKDPKIVGDEPKFPDNYNELSEKAQRCYWDLKEEFDLANPGKYFRANIWSWRPIQLACVYVNEELKMGINMDNWGHNSGDGLDNQQDCNTLALGLEDMLEGMRDKGIKKFGFNLGSWNIKAPDGNGYQYRDLTDDEQEYLENICPNGGLCNPIPVVYNDIEFYPSHVTEVDHLEEFIKFLRHCNGFEIW